MIGTIALVLVGIVLLFFGGIGLLDATRGTPVNRVTARREDSIPSADDPVFRHLLETYTGMTLAAGHEATLMSCGDETYPRLWADLRAARRFIVMQMYYCKPGR